LLFPDGGRPMRPRRLAWRRRRSAGGGGGRRPAVVLLCEWGCVAWFWPALLCPCWPWRKGVTPTVRCADPGSHRLAAAGERAIGPAPCSTGAAGAKPHSDHPRHLEALLISCRATPSSAPIWCCSSSGRLVLGERRCCPPPAAGGFQLAQAPGCPMSCWQRAEQRRPRAPYFSLLLIRRLAKVLP